MALLTVAASGATFFVISSVILEMCLFIASFIFVISALTYLLCLSFISMRSLWAAEMACFF
jgi:hypothetical protein